MTHLFHPLTVRSITLKNRIAVSPMCQYSCEEGMATDWHLVHLGSRAVGGAALVIVEATAVEATGRISPGDMGIWADNHIEPLARIARFIKAHGSIPAIQLAHAGRKASISTPWAGNTGLSDSEGGWEPVGPSTLPFSDDYRKPHELTLSEIQGLVKSFETAAKRALQAGFEIVEIHAAHGYLIHEFLSPISNLRTDDYGGAFENRTRFLCDVVQAVRAVWPDTLPLFVRISATDWAEPGQPSWDAEQSVELARQLQPLGVDLIDCSSGGTLEHAKIPLGPGYQVPFAEEIKREVGILTGAVGMITEPQQANTIIQQDQADIVLLAREMLRDPYWPLHAAHALDVDVKWPVQYERAKPKMLSHSQ